MQNRANVVAIDVKTNREAQELGQITKIGKVAMRPTARSTESIRGVVRASVDFTDNEFTLLLVCKEAAIFTIQTWGNEPFGPRKLQRLAVTARGPYGITPRNCDVLYRPGFARRPQGR